MVLWWRTVCRNTISVVALIFGGETCILAQARVHLCQFIQFDKKPLNSSFFACSYYQLKR